MPADSVRRKVVYLLDGSRGRTGALICARNIARALSPMAQVVLVAPRGAHLPADDLIDFDRVLYLPIHNLRQSVRSILLYLPRLLLCSVRLAMALRRDRAEVLIVNDFYLMQGAVTRVLGFKGKLLTWVRINPRNFGVVSNLWLYAVERSSTRVIAVSKFISSLLPGSAGATVLYDYSTLESVAIKRDFDDDPAFAFVGNYVAGKGQDIALHALAQVLGEFPAATIAFYGDDLGLEKNRAYRRSLEALAERLEVQNNVEFHGFAAKPAVVLGGRMAALNLSSSESFSMTVLEASAVGLPVIATRCGGPEEIVIDGETGHLVPVNDPSACAQAMLALCRDPGGARQMGAAGRRRAEGRFSKNAFQARLQALVLTEEN